MALPTIVSATNLLQDDPTFQKTPISERFYSSRIVNWVEPIEISGKQKTVFYTEFNTNFNIGDRIYIVNGNYDSGNFIKTNKYSKFSDGYRVLGRDGTRLILDIDYTGKLPYEEVNEGEFIRVRNILTPSEYYWINDIYVALNPITATIGSTTITITTAPNTYNKFAGELRTISGVNYAILYTGNLIFTSASFPVIPLLSTTALAANKFYCKRNNTWIDITTEVLANRIIVGSGNYDITNGNLYIVGEDINSSGVPFFRERNAYSWSGTSWEINPLYKQPLISKSNFRYGKFRGTMNDGVFGTYLKRNKWSGSSWNSGIFTNSDWLDGKMSSKSTFAEKSFYTKIVSTASRPLQTIDFTNNSGFGYNVLQDASFLTGELLNGNFINCNIGLQGTYSALDAYFGVSQSFPIKISGKFELCDLNSLDSESATILNSTVVNSNLKNTTIYNSQLLNSTCDLSSISDKESITILDADIWSYDERVRIPGAPGATTIVRGILKLYISDEDYERLNPDDGFYIRNINKENFANLLSDDLKILLPIEKRFRIANYFDNELDDTITVSLKSKEDNNLKFFTRKISTVSPATYTTDVSNNSKKYASIDIDCKRFANYFEVIPQGLNIVQILSKDSNYFLGLIDIYTTEQFLKGAIISNNDFKSGYFNRSTWLSAHNISYDFNIINKSNQFLDIYFYDPNTITVVLDMNKRYSRTYTVFGEDIANGDTVWLNSISKLSGTTQSISGRYKVLTVTNNTTTLRTEAIIRSEDGFTFSSTDTFFVEGAEWANYTSISKFQIENSTIVAGLLRKTGIKNSIFRNVDITNEFTINNLEKLRILNQTFKDNNNTVNAGLLYKSHFINGNWNNGIVYNSIWNGGTFGNGVFKTSYWQDGTFTDGSFIDSKEINQTTPEFNTVAGNRLFLKGTFNSGEFKNSAWIDGTFNNGRFILSDWYSGVWNNGILGSKIYAFSNTRMGSFVQTLTSGTATHWNDGIVENALIGGEGSVYWNGGKFFNGEFTSNGTVSTKESIWYNGEFKGGRFTGLARWKNGNFYGGKFLSYHGWQLASPTNSSTYSTDYGWENGKFFGGEFGNASLGTNSVWYNGEFKDGTFTGRLWYDGVFVKGDFVGGATHNIWESPKSINNEFAWVNSYRNDYYGLWRNGSVVDSPQNYRTESIFTNLTRKTEARRDDTTAKFKNMLWLDGIFDNKSGTIQNSVWLNGEFNNGTFDSGVFNAYADRTFRGLTAISSFGTASFWNNGSFDSTIGTGSFWFSNWKTGTFEKGYMSGAIWEDGIWNYGTAENIYWENGLWRNGNWNGAPFDYQTFQDITGPAPFTMSNGRSKTVLLNIAQNIGTTSIYLLNVFSASQIGGQVLTDRELWTVNTSTSSFNYTPASEFYDSTQGSINNIIGIGIGGLSSTIQSLTCSEWSAGTIIIQASGVSVFDPHIFTTGGYPEDPGIAIGGYNWTGVDPNNPRNSYNIPTSHKLYATSSGLRNVFSSPDTTYEIKIQLTVELKEEVEVEFGIGSDTPLIYTLQSNVSTPSPGILNCYPKQYNLTFLYTTPPAPLTSTDQTFYIRKNGVGLLRILYAQIVRKRYEYHPIHNNSIWSGITASYTDVIFPDDQRFSILGTSDTSQVVSLNFGNGLFKSGLWENGVWNNGIRSNILIGQKDYYKFSNIIGMNGLAPFLDRNSYKLDDNTWQITLKALEPLKGLNVGDKISVGNIVAIDINERRVLSKDYYRITKIDYILGTLTFNLITTFPIRRVELDSDKHLIYVSKNIWLTGAFLNGYFSGIWNNGLFKGYPYITTMEKTQWIDGKFDGGRFISRRERDNIIAKNYNTSLIQRFIFNDRNLASNVGGLKYNSWIDANFFTYSRSHLNQETTLYTVTQSYADFGPSLFGNIFNNIISNLELDAASHSTIINLENLKGWITDDVLESDSTMRDYISLNSQEYSLGAKMTKYTNLLPNDGNFIEPVSNHLPYNISLSPFISEGWTYSDIGFGLGNSTGTWSQGGITGSFTASRSSIINIDTNVDALTTNKLRIKNDRLLNATIILTNTNTQPYFAQQMRFNKIILDNNDMDTNTNRYYVIELDVASYSFTDGQFNSQYTIATFGNYKSMKLVPDINELENPEQIKRQYFYNRSKLDLAIESSFFATETLPTSTSPTTLVSQQNRFDVTFNNISFWEVDMIPFFNYWSVTNNIDKRIKTPYFATAPFIDYTNYNFDFVGNVNLTFDTDAILGQNVATTQISSGNLSGTIIITDPTVPPPQVL